MGATIAGGLLGGCVVARIGLLKGLLIFAVVQGLTTALYIPLYYAGHNVWLLMLTISLENLSSGMATTAIIAFMSVLCDKDVYKRQGWRVPSLRVPVEPFFAGMRQNLEFP